MNETEASVAALKAALDGSPVTFFGVRHHSPVCARGVRDWIRARRPAAVLVEAPADAEASIPLLLDEATVAPVALYLPAERAAAYYPLCDYSPELVALREGRAVGAQLGFIDLPYAHRALGPQSRPVSAQDEAHLARSRYVAELAARTGCRDLDELWDHLFEEGARALDPDGLRWRVAVWCHLARLEYTDAALEADGTLARERAMAWHVRRAMAAHPGAEILVVTGGFHAVQLPHLMDAPLEPPPGGEGEHYVIPYGFAQLDALDGYASGVPAPAFYQRVWEDRADVADLVVEVGREARARGMAGAVSVADELAAATQARQLAALRGHAHPTREDVRDALRSCFVKGEADGIMGLARELFAGDRVGQVPASAGVPPLVADFRRRAEACKLERTSTRRQAVVLEIYRKGSHRTTSRLLHALDLLTVPYAAMIDGPDFIRGVGLERRRERWELYWTPAVEATLIDLAHTGGTLEEACWARLQTKLADAEEAGMGGSLAAATRLLAEACRVGLGDRRALLLDIVERAAREDGGVPSLVAGLRQIDRLVRAGGSLDTRGLETLPELRAVAYRRVCLELRQLSNLNPTAAEEALGAALTLRELVRESPEVFALALFDDALAAITGRDLPAVLRGGAWGVRFSLGSVDEPELAEALRGAVDGATDAQTRVAFVRGLLVAARDTAWRLPAFIETLDATFAEWDGDTFLRSLPELRLAFAELTPREIDRVAEAVAALGHEDLGGLVMMDVAEGEVAFNTRVEQVATAALEAT
ncbi:MAG: DUF5682 family protein [Sandaracinaceae bacterium]